MNSERDVDKPMGNAELRLSLAGIESEVAAVKNTLDEVHTQAKKTNGRVNWLEKGMYVSVGALPLLTIWALWLTVATLDKPAPLDAQQLQQVVESALSDSLTK